jgi:hypothetical protein
VKETEVSTTKVDTYRKNWPRLGAVLAMAIGGATTLGSKKLSTVQVLSAMNFVALLVHQYEEYQDPGYFPGQFNRGIFHSDQPRNYPLTAHAAMCINTAVGYPYYLAPVLFPKVKWVGLSPVVFGFSQAFGHGVVFPRIARAKYSPGFLASILLHVPIGIAYIKALKTQGPIERGTWIKTAALSFAVAFFGILLPELVTRDKNSPYHFSAQQMGSYDTGPGRT